MTKIDGKWLAERLSEGQHGQKAKLARALGVKQKVISEILSGKRRVQIDEAHKIAAFFGETLTIGAGPGQIPGFADAPTPFTPQPGSAVDDLVKRARLADARPMTYIASRQYMDLGIMTGDVIVIDTADHGKVGDIALCSVADTDTSESETFFARRFDPLISVDGMPRRVNQATENVAFFGKVIAILRSSLA